PLPLLSTLFPYTTLFRSISAPTDQLNVSCTVESGPVAAAAQFRHITVPARLAWVPARQSTPAPYDRGKSLSVIWRPLMSPRAIRSEEHTSELQSRFDLVC